MKLPAVHTAVLIVGAGPSGLMMAAQLLRYGIQPVIIDSKQGPTDLSKALAVQARSLEIYRQMGLVDRVLRDGKRTGGVTFNEDGKKIAELPMDDIGDAQTLFPYILMYQQSKNERLLLDYLTQNCCPVYWETTLTTLAAEGNKINLTLTYNNEQINLTSDWVIGADGAHSMVRKQLNIPFKGDTYEHEFYLADITVADMDNDQVQLYLAKTGFAAFFPMPEVNRYRALGNIPALFDGKTDLSLGDVQPHLSQVSALDLKVTECHWFTTYKLHHRMAEKFRSGRCFLVGDAAHIHSPVGGQGMNTGLQDAYNLAWKLAGVINKQYSDQILDSYAAERMPIAQSLLKTTDRAFTFILSNTFWMRAVKKWVLPFLLKKLWGSKNLRKKFFIQVSQTGIAYNESKLNLHLSPASKIIAGDRLPYLKVYDEKKQTETDLHEWCSKPGFTFIAIGKLNEDELFRIAKWITQTYPINLNFFYLPPSNKNRHIFDAFEIGASQHKTLIVRPDMYLGFVNDSIDIGKIDSYLNTVVGWIKKIDMES